MANRIVQAIYDLKDNVTGQLKKIGDAWRGARTDSEKSTDTVEKNNKRLSASFLGLSTLVKKFGAAIAAVGAIAGFRAIQNGIEAVLNTGERFDDLEKKFTTAFGGLDAGAAALDRVRAIAADTPFAFEEVAAAAVALKKRGLDPLDGSLQALLDNAAANDQGMDQLGATIEALGKASLRGTVGVRQLVSLTEQGIPVFDLLGKALNKSEADIREMAKSGQLGGDSIKLLVAELGKLRAGAAAAEVGDLDAQLIKLRDTLTQIEADIAAGGSLDAAREKFQAFNGFIRELAASPEFKKLEVALNDVFVNGLDAAQAFAQNVDFTKLVTQVTELTGALSATFRILEGAGDLLGPVSKAVELSFEPFNQLRRLAGLALNGIATDVEALQERFKKLPPAVAETINPLDAVRREVQLVTDVVGKLKVELDKALGEQSDAKQKAAAIAAAFKALGVDAQNAGGEVTEAGAKIVGALNLLAKEATITGQQFRAAFNKALDAAQTEAEVAKIREALKTAFVGGKLSAEEYGTAIQLAAKKTLEIRNAAELAAGGLSKIGTSAQASARAAIAAMEATRASLAGIATSIAADLAKALKSGAKPETVQPLKDKLAETEAQVNSLTTSIKGSKEQLQQTGDQGVKSADQIAQETRKAAAAVDQQTGAVREMEGAYGGLSKATESSGNSFVAFISLLQQLNDKFAAVSENARLFFVETQRASVQTAKTLTEAILKTLQAGEATERAIARQQVVLEGVVGNYNELAEAAELTGSAAVTAAQDSEQALLQMAAAVREGQGGFELLNQADLDRLSASIAAASARVRELKEQALAADEQLDALGESLQDALDRRAGNEEAILRRQFEQEQQQIKDLAEQGTQAGQQRADELLRLSRRNFEEELRQIAATDAARKASDGKAKSGGGSGAGSGGGTFNQPSTAAGNNTVNVYVAGSIIADTPEGIARYIEPAQKKLERMRR